MSADGIVALNSQGGREEDLKVLRVTGGGRNGNLLIPQDSVDSGALSHIRITNLLSAETKMKWMQ